MFLQPEVENGSFLGIMRLLKCFGTIRILSLAAVMAMFFTVSFAQQGQLLRGQGTNENPWLLIPSLDASQRAEIAQMATNELSFFPDGLIVQRLRPNQMEQAREVFDQHPRIYRNTAVEPYLRQQETPSLCWAACLQPI